MRASDLERQLDVGITQITQTFYQELGRASSELTEFIQLENGFGYVLRRVIVAVPTIHFVK